MLNFKKRILILISIALLSITTYSFADVEKEDFGGKDTGNFIFTNDDSSNASLINSAIETIISSSRDDEAEDEKADVKNDDKKPELQKIDATKEEKLMISYMKRFNPSLSDSEGSKIYKSVVKYSKQYSVNRYLVFAIMQTESNFTPRTSYKGAYGLMQLYYTTLPYLGISMNEVYDIDKNIRAGVKEISQCLNMFGNETTALSAYNWGSGNVKRGNYTTAYANRVLNRRNSIFSYLSK